MNQDFLIRIKDASLCLFVAKKYDLSMGRLELQKLIYLADSMSAYLFVLSSRRGHQTYFYGPYDKHIQNALDALTIRNLVEMHDVNVSNNSIACNYSLNESGVQWVDNLLVNSKAIQRRAQIVDALVYSLIKRNMLSKIKELVYAEPLYVATKSYGYYYELSFESENSGHDYLALIEHYLKTKEEELNVRFVADLYIDYLDTRNQILSGNSKTGGD